MTGVRSAAHAPDQLSASVETECLHQVTGEPGCVDFDVLRQHCERARTLRSATRARLRALQTIHGELRETEASYGKELVRFGQTEAPRLDRLRERLASVGRQIGSSAAGSHDSGEM